MRETGSLQQRLAWLTPCVAVALASLILSAIALIDDPVLNRDGMLYVSLAREVLEHGPRAAFERFNWPFLPLLLAFGSRLTGLDPALVGTAYSVLSVLLLCVLGVRIAERLQPSWRWFAVLFVLGAPVFNAYRADLLRDIGAWALLLLAVERLLAWLDAGGWRAAAGFQAALVGALLFRPECGFVVLVLPFWLLFARGWRGLWRDSPVLLGGFAAFGLIGLAFVLGSDLNVQERIYEAASILNPVERVREFNVAAERMASAVLNEHSASEAGRILFVGLVFTVIAKWAKLLGVFAIPFGYALIRREAFPRRNLFIALMAGIAVVLVLFITSSFYMAIRHAAILALLSLPWVSLGLRGLAERLRDARWQYAAIALVALSALSGVISTGPDKAHLRAAGEWMASADHLKGTVYYSNREIQYYATGHYPVEDRHPEPVDVLQSETPPPVLVLLAGERLSLERVNEWSGGSGYRLHKRFSGDDAEEVRIYVR